MSRPSRAQLEAEIRCHRDAIVRIERDIAASEQEPISVELHVIETGGSFGLAEGCYEYSRIDTVRKFIPPGRYAAKLRRLDP